ncbi:MAG: hypothetical protein NT133_02990 [Alphaproteobacteria bacterium]|nr:hypothetical protein [Alphaproteobacteria bacterium]
MTTNFTVTNESEWDAAIFAIDANSLSYQAYTITLAAPSGILSLTANAPAIQATGTVTIIGNGETLNGDGMVRGIFVSSGTVVLQDLTIANMTARGGDGGPGGGGGAGLGGGLMVMSQASVVLDGVTFTNNSAIGGNGGAGILGGGGGLGGNGGAQDPFTGGVGRGGGSGLPGGYLGDYRGASGVNGAGYGGGGSSGGGRYTSYGGSGGGGGGYGSSHPGQGGGAGVGNNVANSGGGGGLGAGGAIFLAYGAKLSIISASISGGSVAGGSGANGAGGGAAAGSGIYYGTPYYSTGAITLAPPQGKRITIADSLADDNTIGGFFRGLPLLVQGAGTVDLQAANTITADITIDGGTLELGTPAAAGSGILYFSTQPGMLAIAGSVMPTNRISGFSIGQTIDLQNVVATSATASIDASGQLAIPTASGSVALTLDPLSAFAGGTFSLAADGNGGTKVTTNANPVGGVVTVTGATGGVFAIPYASIFDTGVASYFASIVSGQIAQNLTTRALVTGAPLPNVPAGQSLVLYDTIGQSVILPDTVPASLFSKAAGVTTVTSGAANADLIVVGDGGLNFTAGLGIFNAFAGRGQKTINLAPGVGGGYFQMGDGDATINAIGGNSNVNIGDGNHVITLGIGYNYVQTSGSNTVMGGPGGANIYHDGTGSDLILMGSGSNSYTTAGSATVAGGTGIDDVRNYGTGSVIYFAGTAAGSFAGAGTVVGNSGRLLAYSPSLVFVGTGATSVTAGFGTSTVVGNPAGNMVVTQSYGDALVFAQGATTVEASRVNAGAPIGSATVLGISGTITASGARGLFLAAPGGNNHINVSTDSTVFGVAAGDVLSAADLQYNPVYGSATNILAGGAGAETISGVGSTAINVFFAGSGPEFIEVGDWSTSIVTGTGAETIVGGQGIALIAFVNGNHPDVLIQGFDPNKDYLTFINYGTGEAAAALAGAQTTLSNETITLSDGTHITLQGFTGLTAANIL